jgi:hypothetical protein
MQIAAILANDNYIYLTEDSGRCLSIAVCDCTLAIAKLDDLSSPFKMGIAMSMNNRSATWLEVNMRLGFIKLEGFIFRHSLCDDNTMRRFFEVS